jgi:hypothetical protein
VRQVHVHQRGAARSQRIERRTEGARDLRIDTLLEQCAQILFGPPSAPRVSISER